jgi:hypothetical protein
MAGSRRLVRLIVVAALVVGGTIAANAVEPLRFNRDIRPILFDACVSCHGPDSASRQADLRLDQRDGAVEMGAIVPGDADASEMIRRILSDDEFEQMPPPESKKTLTAEQIETLKRWVAEGAAYEPHWSFIPPTRPASPQVANSWWPRNDIDRFIAARLEAEKLAPAPEADRRALARRVSLDLNGLPPKPELVQEFLNDTRADAYERLVDKLLDSPDWGEHRARTWLDVARYGDTHGIHFDNYREMWKYRDWVIDAFNRNLPYDRFTLLNLAGDLVPNATLDDKIASGFNRCNITTNEGGAIDEEYAVLYTRDRTETTALAWMGLTVGCAVCHDHKFDPVSQREFYELAAFFNNTTQRPMDGNVKDTPPMVVVPSAADRERWDALPAQIAQAETNVNTTRDAARPRFDEWLAKANANDAAAFEPSQPADFVAPLDQPPATEEKSPTTAASVLGQSRSLPLSPATKWVEGPLGAGQAAVIDDKAAVEIAEAGDLEKDQPFYVSAWIKLPAAGVSGSIVARMDEGNDYRGWDLWVEGKRIGGHLIHAWPGNALKVLTVNEAPTDKWIHVVLAYDGNLKASGYRVWIDGVKAALETKSDALTETTRTEVALKVGQRSAGSGAVGVAVTDLRISCGVLEETEINRLAGAPLASSLRRNHADRKPAEIEALFAWWLKEFDNPHRDAVANVASLQADLAAIKSRSPITHVMQERETPAAAFVLSRGEYDQRLDEVKPEVPEVLPAFSDDAPRNRLGFAQWLLRDDHPLTARVTVNRCWQEVFGTGLVSTAGDFGVSGQLPSHPELLDWLAVEFRESGWDVKRLYRLMVTSATYRQSAAATPEEVSRDPDNRLLSRGPRRRMDAEMVRDHALATSGLLVKRVGGPSVRPYQPPGVWEAVAMPESDTKSYTQDKGDALYRRSLYTFWKRAAPPASMDVFNAPSRETCTVTRECTNTPLQALVTLNDPQFIEAARVLAQRALHEGGADDNAKLHWIAEQVIARPLLDDEAKAISQSLGRLLEHYAADVESAKQLLTVGEAPVDESLPADKLAAWTLIASAISNADEALNK